MQKDTSTKPTNAISKASVKAPLNYSKLITTFTPDVKFTSSLPERQFSTHSRRRVVDEDEEEEIDWERDEYGPYYYTKAGDLIRP